MGKTRTSISLCWADNANNELLYYVQRSTAGANGPWVTIAVRPANSTTYTALGLRNNTTYWFRVMAYNASGFSAPSNVTSGLTLP